MNADDAERRAKRLTRCACGETATGARDRNGNPACRAHAAPSELLPIRPDPPPRVTDGAIGGGRGQFAVDDPDGAASWEWLPWDRVRRDDAGRVVLDADRRLIFDQRPPPVHVKSAKPGKAGKGRAPRKEQRDDVRRVEAVALRQLDVEARAVALCRMQGGTREEIAARLGLTLDQVRRAVTRINEAMRGAVRRDGWEVDAH